MLDLLKSPSFWCSAFDLGVADFRARPDAEMGYQACLNATDKENREGNIGAEQRNSRKKYWV